MKYINVVGSSASGKTAFSKHLSKITGFPHLEIDAIHWGPDWTEAGPEQLAKDIEKFIKDHPDGWIIDGSYFSKLGPMILDKSDTLIYLDIALPINITRLLWRSFKRIITRQDLWDGSRESPANAYLLIKATLKNHSKKRELMKQRKIEFERTNKRFIRLTSRHQAEEFIKSLDS